MLPMKKKNHQTYGIYNKFCHLITSCRYIFYQISVDDIFVQKYLIYFIVGLYTY